MRQLDLFGFSEEEVVKPVPPKAQPIDVEVAEQPIAVTETVTEVAEIPIVVAEMSVDGDKQTVAITETASEVAEKSIAVAEMSVDGDKQPVAVTETATEAAEKSIAIAEMPVDGDEQPVAITETATQAAESGKEEDVIIISHNLFSGHETAADMPNAKKQPAKTPGKRGRKSFKDIDAEIYLVEVPDDEVLFKKLYYSISEVAKWFNVNTSLLRFWENEFDILKPRKNRKGDRLFRPEDVKNLQVIHHLLRQRKFSIEGAKKYLKQNKSRAEVNIQLIQSLTKFRSFLLEMKANLGA